MAENDGTKTCSTCGSVYQMSYTSTIMRDQDQINCEVCGALLKRWSEAKIWGAKLVERHENHKPA